MARTLRSWLKLEPHAVKVKATDADGDPKVVVIGTSKSRWRDAENALKGAVACEALNAENETLRTWNDPLFIAEGTVATKVAAASEAKTELSELARIITESNDAAVGRLVEILQVNLQQNAQLVNVLSERNRQLELAWQRVFTQSVKDRPVEDDATQPTLGMNEQLILQLAPTIVSALLGGGAAPQAAQKPPPTKPTKPNGAS